MGALESIPINKPEQVVKIPEVDLERMPKAEYYWHGTLTGREGEIIDSILTSGLKPKEEVDVKNVGNANTPVGKGVFVSNSGVYVAEYLKKAVGYNYEVGGLPTFISVKVENRDVEYQYDTDVVIEGDDSFKFKTENMLCWFSLILSYDTVDEFLNEGITSMTGKKIQEKIRGLKGKTILESKKDIWEILNLSESITFLEGTRLVLFLKKVDVKRWDKFLMILNKLAPTKNSLIGNIAKKNGWEAEDLKRVYAITPGGDKDWRKWAKLIPSEITNRWDEWDTLKDKNGNQIPGKGKMIRVK